MVFSIHIRYLEILKVGASSRLSIINQNIFNTIKKIIARLIPFPNPHANIFFIFSVKHKMIT